MKLMYTFSHIKNENANKFTNGDESPRGIKVSYSGLIGKLGNKISDYTNRGFSSVHNLFIPENYSCLAVQVNFC